MTVSALNRKKCMGDFWDNGIHVFFSFLPAKYILCPDHITQAQEGLEKWDRRNPALEPWDPDWHSGRPWVLILICTALA